MKNITIIAALALSIIACNKKEAATATETTDATTAAVVNTTTEAGVEDHTGHDHAATPAENPQAIAENATKQTQPKTNPAHGQPGHRCELPVGAPLDGSVKPGQNNAVPGTQNTGSQAPANTSNNPYFLSSKAAPQSNQPSVQQRIDQVQQAQVQPQQQVQPQVQPQPQAEQTTLAGMKGKPNPAHGQTGHRCDIQVGQPLP
ncbi:MAG: hypothetical protein KBS98_05315 [Flavobacterium sp.]|nr:hypothetical protein [Candidatus Neoflavobacterium equi]